MPEWKSSNLTWLTWEEQLAPNVWLYMCKRPTGWATNRTLPWGWVYVFDGAFSSRQEHIEDPVCFHEEAPLEMRCVELEIRKRYLVAHDGLERPKGNDDGSVASAKGEAG